MVYLYDKIKKVKVLEVFIMEKYVPDVYQKSIYTINYNKLKNNGIKCLLFDLDNTLVPYSEKKPNDKVIELFNDLKKQGFKVVLFSNSPKKRLRPFKEILEVDCCARACKPSPKKFISVIEELGFNISEVAIIGDQLLTDILGGNNVGITTILTDPLTKKDLIVTKFNRFLEGIVIKKLLKKNLFNKGRYYYE
jgi:HAD superfamily phosphatase (TIGR01668 family)